MSRRRDDSLCTGRAPWARGSARRRGASPFTSYDDHLDGLFTYCLSVLCEHDAATAALADALTVAGRRHRRAPRDPAERRAWLYALARWACLRGPVAARRTRGTALPPGLGAPPTGPAGRGATGDPVAGRSPAGTSGTARTREEQRRRRERALLAWPDAAGAAPEQREVLELTVRHHLTTTETAAVLGMRTGAARELIASAACEVERARAAAVAVRTGDCPAVAGLSRDPRLLGAPLRRRLVRHVDGCPRCRPAAEAATPGLWPGTSVTPALPLVTAPRTALRRVMAAAGPGRRHGPRFDRRGYPVHRADAAEGAARRHRLCAPALRTASRAP